MTELTTKLCCACKEAKDHAEFSKRAASKDGLQPRCKACASAHSRNYHKENRPQRVGYMADRYQRLHEHEIERARQWRDENPEKVLASARKYYYANADTVRAKARVTNAVRRANWTPERRDAFREYLKIWADQNRERVRELARAWQKAHPAYGNEKSRRRNALKRSAMIVPFTLAQLELRLSMFPGCWMCGGPKEEVEHVKPLAKGGAHCLSNLAPACRSCNARKSDIWHGVRATIQRFRVRPLFAVQAAA